MVLFDVYGGKDEMLKQYGIVNQSFKIAEVIATKLYFALFTSLLILY